MSVNIIIHERSFCTFVLSVYSVERDGREGSEGQCHKEKERKEWSGTGRGQGHLPKEGGLYFAAGVPEFLVTPLLKGPVCILSQGRFKESVRSWTTIQFCETPHESFIQNIYFTSTLNTKQSMKRSIAVYRCFKNPRCPLCLDRHIAVIVDWLLNRWYLFHLISLYYTAILILCE